MDVQVHVTVLRLHSEELTRLCTQVSTLLGTLEQTLSENPTLAAARDSGLLDEVATLQRRLCVEGEMFCHRLHSFVEEPRCPRAPAAAEAMPRRNKKAGLGNLLD